MDGDGGERKRVVEVEFNQQQDVFLEQLRELGTYGTTDAEVIRSMFQEFLAHRRI